MSHSFSSQFGVQRNPSAGELGHIAAQKNYYAFETGGGQKTHAVEEALATIESQAAPVFAKLASGNRDLSPGECAIFCTFLSLGWSRVPKFRDEVEHTASRLVDDYSQKLAADLQRFAESVRNAERALGHTLGDSEELRQAILNREFEVTTRPEFSLRMMFAHTFELAAMIAEMRWSFRETEEATPLVTSDSPVILNNPTLLEGEGPPIPAGLEVTFPVSPQLLFVATWDGHAGTGPMRPFLARQVNKLVALAADRFVYSAIQVPAIAAYLKEPRKSLIPDFAVKKLRIDFGIEPA